MIDVSVVIVNWNTRELLHQTLTTLYKETINTSFETIVYDNGSTDGSVDLIHGEWPQVSLIASPINRGFAVGNNSGFRQCRGRYILLLNSDTIVLASTIKSMTRILDEHPDAGCVGCRHLNGDGSLQRSMDNYPSLLNDFLSYTELHRLNIFQPLLRKKFAWWSDHNASRKVDWVNGACMMVRREVVEQVGGLDEEFFIYAEEIDWCYRMSKAGWNIYFTPEGEIIHLGGKAMDSVPDRRLILKYIGQYRFYRKHYSIWRQFLFRILVAAIAISRMMLILFLQVTKLLRRSISSTKWEKLTQEPIVTSPAAMLRVWWKILWLPKKLQ
ncbi:MAG: hypothetical protein QG657_3701 [Acidobacteriota bacterium]|nr:hypothetical protein [Acidobacteriota bacterium]